MREGAAHEALDRLAYLRGPEDEPGMPSDVQWDKTTLSVALRRCVARWGDRELLVFPGRSLTGSAFAEEVSRLARGLMALGVGPGDNVAVWLANLPEYAVAEFALAALGAAMVPINIRYKKDEVEFALRQSDSSTLIFAPAVLKTDCVAVLREMCPELGQQSDYILRSTTLPQLKNVIVLGSNVAGARSYDDVLRLGDSRTRAELDRREQEVRPESVLVLQYTSGTTAFPKAAMLTQAQTLRNAYQMSCRAGFTDQDRLLSAMPMFHVGGSVCALLGAITIGYRLYMSPNVDAAETLRLIEEERITAYVGLEPMYLAMRNHEDFNRRSRKSLKKGWSAGTPAILRMVAQDIGIRNICSLYGLSEASPNVCIAHWEKDPYEKRISTMGRPQAGTEVKVVDPASGQVAAREVRGEICVRGWTVMKGYYKNLAETSRVIDAEGWLHTGDAGLITEDGYLVWTGRLKDTIRVGGENVSAVEVEHLLCTHPKIVTAVVVGVPDKRYQEVGLAYVQLKLGEQATEDEMIEYCKQRLAVFKVPKHVRFVESFPTTGTGKVQKFMLRQQAIRDLEQSSK
jgi:fatty-acyl-CoA synthase